MDTAWDEQVQAELDAMIRRRDRDRRRDEGERAREELWQASVRRYHQKQETEHLAAWCEHFRRMRAVHWGLGDEYDAKLRMLENGHQERGDAA